jgi:hypothetical protein
MMGQLYLSGFQHQGIGEGIVFENTIGRALLVGIKPALVMPLNCSMGLFPIVSWAFRRGIGMGGGVRVRRKGHQARFRDRPTGSHCGGHVWRVRGLRAGRHVGGTSRGGKQWSLESTRGVGGGSVEGGRVRALPFAPSFALRIRILMYVVPLSSYCIG